MMVATDRPLHSSRCDCDRCAAAAEAMRQRFEEAKARRLERWAEEFPRTVADMEAKGAAGAWDVGVRREITPGCTAWSRSRSHGSDGGAVGGVVLEFIEVPGPDGEGFERAVRVIDPYRTRPKLESAIRVLRLGDIDVDSLEPPDAGRMALLFRRFAEEVCLKPPGFQRRRGPVTTRDGEWVRCQSLLLRCIFGED